MSNLAHGILGMACLLAIAVICSPRRREIRLRVVAAALLAQIALGALVLFVPIGRAGMAIASNAVAAVLGYGEQGIAFLFGGLVGPQMNDIFHNGSGYVIALHVLPQIIYISALIAVLYYLQVMQAIAFGLGWMFRKVIGTTPIESFAAVTTIFLGQSEAPVAIKPFLPLMTGPELFTVMCSGAASVAGSILAGYAGLGVRMDYLLAASLMAIPGGLLFSKLLMPSDGHTDITTTRVEFDGRRPTNIIEAIAVGTMNGVHVAVAVGAMLISFIGLIALLDGCLAGIGHWFGHPGWSLAAIFGVVFAPLAWLIGVPWTHATLVGDIIGQKIVFNEFVAYVGLSPYFHNGVLDAHTLAVATFALCGFANFSSIGIQLATYTSLVPERRAEVARYGLRAILAGTLSNLMSATIAGMFIS